MAWSLAKGGTSCRGRWDWSAFPLEVVFKMDNLHAEVSVHRPSPRSVAQTESTLFVMAIGILVFTVCAFGLVLLRQPVRFTRYTPLVSVHAALMVGWYSLFVIQAHLIVDGKYQAHRLLGLSSLVLVIAIVGTGGVVAANFSQETGRRGTLAADVGILLTFLILYGVAVWAAVRGRLEAHKRLMLVASISMMGPALTRALDVVAVPRMTVVLLYPLVLVALPWIYDRRTVGRLHKVSFWATAFALSMFLVQLLAFVATGGG